MPAIDATLMPLAAEAGRLPLAHSEAHVWTLADTPGDPARYLPVLDAGERARATRFKFETRRREYIAAHGLLRVALSRYDGRPPAAWRFTAEPGGRPIVAGRAGETNHLFFSLSHAAGRALVAIAREPAIGIDLEGDASLARMAEVAPRILTPREAAEWKRAPDATAAARFALARWTLKEAYAKGRGLGLKLDFSRFGFAEIEGAWRLDAPPADEARPGAWRFFSFAPWPTAHAALAMRPARGGDVAWRLLRVTP